MLVIGWGQKPLPLSLSSSLPHRENINGLKPPVQAVDVNYARVEAPKFYLWGINYELRSEAWHEVTYYELRIIFTPTQFKLRMNVGNSTPKWRLIIFDIKFA